MLRHWRRSGLPPAPDRGTCKQALFTSPSPRCLLPGVQHVELPVGGLSGDLMADPARQLNVLVHCRQFDFGQHDALEQALVFIDFPYEIAVGYIVPQLGDRVAAAAGQHKFRVVEGNIIFELEAAALDASGLHRERGAIADDPDPCLAVVADCDKTIPDVIAAHHQFAPTIRRKQELALNLDFHDSPVWPVSAIEISRATVTINPTSTSGSSSARPIQDQTASALRNVPIVVKLS